MPELPQGPLKSWVGGDLSNKDLLPVEDQRWRWSDILSMWMSAMHNLGNYAVAAGLFVVGLNGWQILLVWFVGLGIAMLFTNAMGRIGQRLAVPYPVVARMSFGVLGANLPALARGLVAIAWYGIQTYLASAALVLMAVAMDPALASYTHPGFLGLSPLGWAAFCLLWLVQIVILTRGMEAVRKFQHLCGPGIWVLMCVLAAILLAKAGWHLDLNASAVQVGAGETWRLVIKSIGTILALHATMMLNFADFARFTGRQRDVKVGNFWGLPVNGGAFAVVTVIATVASLKVYGEAITDPAGLLVKVGNPAFLVIGAFCFVVATMGINIVGNVVPAAFDLANFAPKYITFKRGAAIACVLGAAVLPWKLYSSTVAITYFLGSVGALMGPLIGIVLTDYYLVRKTVVFSEDFYSHNRDGAYAYGNGWNPVAIKSLIPGAVVAILLAVVPALASWSFLSWFAGTAVSALLYYQLSRELRQEQGKAGQASRLQGVVQ